MNHTLMLGSIVVTVALVVYALGVLTEQFKQIVNRVVILFISVGFLLDLTATVLMILGSRNGPITLHGIIGYSALTAMLIEVVCLWRHWLKNGQRAMQPTRFLHLYTRFAYAWWVIAYIAGGMLAMSSVRH